MLLRRIALAVFALLLALMPLAPVPEFWITQANYIGLYTLVVFGLVLLTGVAGLTSFGQAAFVGLGAYSAAYLTLTYGVSPWLTVWIGLAITAVAALVLAWVTLRMSGHYLPLATIAWGLSLFYLLGNLDFLGKYDGLLGIPALNFFGKPLNTGRSFFYLLWTHRRPGGDRHDPPARLAHRPGDARRQGRLDHGRGDGHRHLPRQGHGVRPGGAARQRLRAGSSPTSSAPSTRRRSA